MLRSLTAPLYQTLTTTQRLHIIWQSVRRSEAPPTKKIYIRQLWDVPLQISQRQWMRKHCCTYKMLACLLVNFLPTQDPASCFLHRTVARRCRVIWCVTMRWKPLRKSPLWVPPTGRISVPVSFKTRQNYSLSMWKHMHDRKHTGKQWDLTF